MDNALYIENRKRFIQQLEVNSIAIFISNAEIPSNGDAIYPYKQNSDLLWLCGIEQPDTFYVVIKTKKKTEEFLFIKKSNPAKEIWDGKFITQQEAKALTGIDTVLYADDFFSFLQLRINALTTIYLNTNENDRKNGHTQNEMYLFIEKIKQLYPLHQYKRSAEILKYTRAIKTKYELERISQAIEVTNLAFQTMLQKVRVNCFEYEIEAHLIHQFLLNKSTGFAFSPIVASGDNARILHYISNAEQCKNGDMVLLDFGATFQHYHADITRTFPVNGTFTKRQKEVYNACLHLHKYATALLQPNVLLSTYTEEVGKEATKVFLKIGLLSTTDIKNEDKKNPAYRKYLYHGISHHLGLDVHDFADREQPLQVGMVLTVEPGIYIQEEKMGIRLENNVVITKNGNTNLSKQIPIEINDIEKLMKR